MRHNPRLTLAIGGAAVVLAAGSTLAMAASGAFRSTLGPRYASVPRTAACTAPVLPGQIVGVTLTDRAAGMGYHGSNGYGGMMGRGGMTGTSGRWPAGTMSVQATPASVAAGTVSLRVTNTGGFTHELVVLPLTGAAHPGQRSAGSDGTVSESGRLGEASNNCGADTGEGINPGGVSWTTITLTPGRYELICNIPGHYAAGMYTELDVA